jgi:hypothetical protein
MKIVIPSRGRPNKQTTIESLPKNLRKDVVLIVPINELHLYWHWGAHVELRDQAPGISGISDKRQWIAEQYGPKVCMVDDDLVFAMRRDDDPTKFRTALDQDIELLFGSIESGLENYAHVGVSGREGANRKIDPLIEVGRMTRILGYRTDVLQKEGCRFDRLQFMQDFDMTLQLLRRGYPNCIINWAVQNQGGSNSEGGCSTIRTPEAHAVAANGLASLHPEFVSVVEKTTKTAWGGGVRTDVRVQWKEAFKSAGITQVLD